jgi:hypothetical protein
MGMLDYFSSTKKLQMFIWTNLIAIDIYTKTKYGWKLAQAKVQRKGKRKITLISWP